MNEATSSIPSKITRLILGTLLPVPLFIVLFYGSYLYQSYHGYDNETNQYLLDNLEASRSHARTDLLIFIVFGYIYMGLPSLGFSFLIERQRTKRTPNLRRYLGLAAFLGFIASFIFLYISGTLTSGSIEQTFYAVLSSTLVGLITAFLLLSIKRRKNSETDLN